ncbi:cytochrome b [Sandarakinorhabdus sp. DWP1-3-1]|uniref:cytochrome b n=1 Tax=Sandarakinorhabdus sp. DWP1-3-1 TaxID=2804627 RepID=UPI003CE9B0C7
MTAVEYPGRYSTVAILLHWITAVLVIGNLVGGLGNDCWFDSPDPATQQAGATLVALHKSIGLTILVLTLVRLAWRLTNPPPPLPTHMTRGEVVLARTTHVAFYLLLLLMPLSGWAMVSTGRHIGPVSWFGLFDVPPLPLPTSLGGLFHESHETIGLIMMLTLVLHVAGALKHHLFDRDNVLARILPRVRRRAP